MTSFILSFCLVGPKYQRTALGPQGCRITNDPDLGAGPWRLGDPGDGKVSFEVMQLLLYISGAQHSA